MTTCRVLYLPFFLRRTQICWEFSPTVSMQIDTTGSNWHISQGLCRWAAASLTGRYSLKHHSFGEKRKFGTIQWLQRWLTHVQNVTSMGFCIFLRKMMNMGTFAGWWLIHLQIHWHICKGLCRWASVSFACRHDVGIQLANAFAKWNH